MTETVSKSKFKPLALEYFRRVQETGEEIVITDRGKPVAKPGKFHPDPADRLIVVTARMLGATLVTEDEKVRCYPHVRTLG
jgi:PIN domain nuclease of toxin-antitoxin system